MPPTSSRALSVFMASAEFISCVFPRTRSAWMWPDDSITPCSEFVWRPEQGQRMALCRERLALLLDQHVDDRLNIAEPLRIYLRRGDLPEIIAERRVQPTG